MTSKGRVTNVATVPAVVAKKLCTTAELAPELGGTKRSARDANRWVGRSNGSLTYFLFGVLIKDDKYSGMRGVTKSGRGESLKHLGGTSPDEGY